MHGELNINGMSKDFEAAIKKCVEIEESFSAFSEGVKADGALSRREKELIGLALSVVKECVWCVRRHTTAALDQGASYEQIIEAAGMVAVMDGGPGLARIRQLVLLSLEEYEKGYRPERVGPEWQLVKKQ